MAEPLRTCIITKQKHPQRVLLRFVAHNEILVHDARNALPGRGAYVVADPAVVRKIAKMTGKFRYVLQCSKLIVPPGIAEGLCLPI